MICRVAYEKMKKEIPEYLEKLEGYKDILDENEEWQKVARKLLKKEKLDIKMFKIPKSNNQVESLEQLRYNLLKLKSKLEIYSEEIKPKFGLNKIIIATIDSYIIKIEQAEKNYINPNLIKSNKSTENLQSINLQMIIENVISNYLKDIIDELYNKISYNCDSIYIKILKAINEFLFSCGIYTKEINKNETIDYNYMENISNFEDTNESAIDKIKKIERYPYLFNNNIVVLYGKAKI